MFSIFNFNSKMKQIYSLFVIFFITLSSQAQVVISQVYGGGGTSGTPTYTHDFIEIFNRGTVPQNLNGWSVQYMSAIGTSSWQVTNLTDFTLQPGQYYLIQQNSTSSTNGAPLPTPDVSATINMSSNNAKVALVNSTTALSGANPTSASIVDLVGYGTTPNGYEGSGPTGTALTNTLSAQRLNAGCTDTNSNPADFTTLTPIARNTASPLNICPPSLTITSPINTTVYSPETTNVNVSVNVANFAVAIGTGDGHIHYTVNGGGVMMKYDTAPIAIPTTPGSTYTIYMELVDNSHTPIVPAVNKTVTFTVANYTNVATLAAARAAGVNAYVNFTGEAFVSHTRATRNQKYIQDATAGILIDDLGGAITTPFTNGDSISSIKGQLIDFNGVLEFIPNQNATKPSTGNTITPQLVTIADITANINNYESELVRITGATFADGNGTMTFAANTVYNISDGNTMLFRTFPEADYIGTVIPNASTSIIALVSENNGTAQVSARSIAEITLSTIGFDAISGLQVYPNPVKDGNLFITSPSGLEKSVAVYDLLGKQVLNIMTSNEVINVSNLNTGIYMVKITEEGKTATRKLVVK